MERRTPITFLGDAPRRQFGVEERGSLEKGEWPTILVIESLHRGSSRRIFGGDQVSSSCPLAPVCPQHRKLSAATFVDSSGCHDQNQRNWEGTIMLKASMVSSSPGSLDGKQSCRNARVAAILKAGFPTTFEGEIAQKIGQKKLGSPL